MSQTALHLIWLMETAGVSAARARALLDHCETAEAVYALTTKQALTLVALHPEEQKRFEDKSLTHAEAILGKCRERGVRVMTIFDDAYPQRLKNIYDPPMVLYILGGLPDLSRLPAVSVVGHRKATPYGLAAAEKLGYQLSQAGYIVVSGMVKGIDGAAHKGALKGPTPTVAVFGTAIDSVYPAENTWLFKEILGHGAVVSEYPPGKPGHPYFFPQRNRIISGLSLGTVVVEAARKSGSLITANLALDQGRDVFAVPGAINVASSEGANDLIKKGAKLISDAYDVIAEYAPIYGSLPPPRREPTHSAARPKEEAPKPPSIRAAFAAPPPAAFPPTGDPILDALAVCPLHVDDLVSGTGQPEHTLMAALTMLELEGKVRQKPGKFFERLL